MKRTMILMLALCLLLPLMGLAQESEGRVELLARNATWLYNDQGVDLGADWTKAVDTNGWKSGAAPLGFGDDVSETDPTLPLATEVIFGDNEDNKHMTTYFFIQQDMPALDGFAAMEFYIHVDDGAVVYLNGEELFRKGIADGDVTYETGAKFSPKEELFYVALEELTSYKEGLNELAVEVHQDGGDSSDLWFELGLVAVTEMPEAIDWTSTALPNADVAEDDITRVALTYNGDTATQMGFTWYTNQATVASDVQLIPYVEIDDTDDLDFSGAIAFTGRFTRSTNAPAYLVHKAVATGLEPGAAYWYRLGDAANDNWSDVGSFTTDNRDGVFTFINVADSQAKSFEEAQLAASTFEIAVDTVPDADFIMINGDVVDTGAKEEEWGWVMDEADGVLLNIPLMAASGNHDEDDQSFYEHFNVTPAEGSYTKSGVIYSYDYENTHFIVLNTNENSAQFNNFTPFQLGWLRQDSQAAIERGVDWQIVVMHKGPYTTSNHATDEDIMGANGVRTQVAPIFAQLGIDLVLQGHDHLYALSKPINALNEAVEPVMQTAAYNGIEVDYMVNPDGVVYMNPNTAGPKVYYKNKDIAATDPTYYDKFLWAQEHPAAKYAGEGDTSRPPRSIIQNFVAIQITPDAISAVVYEIDRNVGDEPYVMDTFGILRK